MEAFLMRLKTIKAIFLIDIKIDISMMKNGAIAGFEESDDFKFYLWNVSGKDILLDNVLLVSEPAEIFFIIRLNIF